MHIPELTSDHEEADTKLVAFLRASQLPPGSTAMIRSPSGDIDIITLFVCHDFSDTQILIDNGSGKNRKIIDALLGMHAFFGNDYVSSFFRKGKLAVWKTVTKNNAFVELFSSLGTEVTVSEELVRRLEWFVRSLYGYPRIQSVNEARRKVFWDRFHKENKIIDLSLMPPCSSNLRYHIMRANYVAYIFRHAGQLQMDLESPDGHGWNADGNVVCME